MATPPTKLDGPTDSYERTRPRYPVELFAHAVTLLPAGARPTVVDVGAGTGIALEALLPQLSADAEVHAVDVSGDMINIGREKFPQVAWEQGKAEEFLDRFTGIDFVVSAQSYQWMDRPAFLSAAARALRPGGVCMVVQNSLDYQVGGLAAEYENLLEEISPFHSRSRAFKPIDVETELSAHFDEVERRATEWRQPLTINEFVAMSSSSTQGQRAIAAAGPLFLRQVRALCAKHVKDGRVQLPYVTEAFYGKGRA
ncbi:MULTISPECIES: class I SAM-dependent methyltransferase [Pseudofrankia]|uniref:class I SAM-dependent methyltransferase n=1 Tax=Pseudofrankia TaxID=2994363 RepID=UPI000234D167|nr:MULTISPECIES: class I SAM-dependent methyltransferase [Pseudofrankia]OHV41327.1 methyltransferase type 11 [Pseudofrankia sp. EUN1h]